MYMAQTLLKSTSLLLTTITSDSFIASDEQIPKIIFIINNFQNVVHLVSLSELVLISLCI